MSSTNKGNISMSNSLWQCTICPVGSLLFDNKQQYELHQTRANPEVYDSNSESNLKDQDANTLQRGIADGTQVLVDSGVELSQSAAPKVMNVNIGSSLPDLFQGSLLSDEVFKYYASFEDKVEACDVYDTPVTPRLEELPGIEKSFIEYCLKERLSTSKCEEIFLLLQAVQGAQLTPSIFKTPTSSASYVHQARELYAAEEGWKTAAISTQVGVNRTGSLRNIFDIPRDVLDKTGLDAICTSEQLEHSGERVFSHPMHGRNAA